MKDTPCRRLAPKAIAGALAGAVLLGSVGARAGEARLLASSPGTVVPAMLYRPVNNAPAPEAELSPEVQQSLGCAIAGTAGTAAAIVAGGENLVNIIAGGVVAPQNKAVLYIGLVGVVFASFCAIGQALTPLYLYAVSQPEPPEPPQQARAVYAVPRGDRPVFRVAVSAHGPLAALVANPAGPAAR